MDKRYSFDISCSIYDTDEDREKLLNLCTEFAKTPIDRRGDGISKATYKLKYRFTMLDDPDLFFGSERKLYHHFHPNGDVFWSDEFTEEDIERIRKKHGRDCLNGFKSIKED